jgi:hypothetical protein
MSLGLTPVAPMTCCGEASGFFLWTAGGGSVLQPRVEDDNHVTGFNANHVALVFALYSAPDAGTCPSPFAYTAAGGYVALPALPASVNETCGEGGSRGSQDQWALAVNDANVIVGAYDITRDSFNFHAVRWTPK